LNGGGGGIQVLPPFLSSFLFHRRSAEPDVRPGGVNLIVLRDSDGTIFLPGTFISKMS
jgi:hypothetical protein